MRINEKNLREELVKDFYQPDYLSQFKINGKKRKADIAAIIPTYNRCPFDKESKNYEYNPLSMCVRGLLLQKAPIVEIIIIDDASTDNTREVVESLAKKAYATKGVKIKYIYNENKMGSSVARNIGAKHASTKYLFFLDDDCISAPYLSFISMIVIKKLEKNDKNFSALVLPVYNRASFPSELITISDLTRSFFKKGTRDASFHAIPLEYVEKNNFLNKNLKIFKPLQVYQTWGHFICDRSKYLDVGGFPDFATWPNKVGEEIEFACRLVENIYTLYYLPDPKASSYHGAFGAKLGNFRGHDWLSRATDNTVSLVKFSKICQSGIISGNRVNAEDFFYSRIIAYFCILYKRNMKEAINWAKESYEDFVAEQKETWRLEYPQNTIPFTEKREEIWYRAIGDGLDLLLGVEQKKLAKLNEFIESLKIKGKFKIAQKPKNIFEEIIKFWN